MQISFFSVKGQMTIIDYIKKTTGLNIVLGNIPDEVINGLPLYLRKGKYQEIFIEGKRVILDMRKSFAGITPDRLVKQKELLEKYFSATMVYCFEEIESYQRQRLIKKRIAFILLNRQMFIPTLLLDLKEFGAAPTVKKETLGAMSQLLVLYHLQKESIENIPLGEITTMLPVSAMSISRAISGLVTSGICKMEGKKTKVIQFLFEKRELWDVSLPLLNSPVKRKIYFDDLPESLHLMISGEAALEHYSNLSSGGDKQYAISVRQYHKMKKLNTIPEINLHDGEIALEIWNYDPTILSNSNFVDPLSLYLTFKDHEDERIQMSLDETIGKIKW